MKNKTLSYYKGLNYNLVIEKIVDEDGQEYICYTKELGKKSCFGFGETPEKAIASFSLAKEDFIEYLFENKIAIPEPQEVYNNITYSGIFSVRTSPQLHSLLAEQADKHNLSINAYINQILSSASYLDETKYFLDSRIRSVETFLKSHHEEICFSLTNFIFEKKPYKKISIDFDSYLNEEQSLYLKII